VTGYNSSSTPVEYPFHDLVAHILFRATGELKQVKDRNPSGFRNAGTLTISSSFGKLILECFFGVFSAFCTSVDPCQSRFDGPGEITVFRKAFNGCGASQPSSSEYAF
jgi:hypothetical protein